MYIGWVHVGFTRDEPTCYETILELEESGVQAYAWEYRLPTHQTASTSVEEDSQLVLWRRGYAINSRYVSIFLKGLVQCYKCRRLHTWIFLEDVYHALDNRPGFRMAFYLVCSTFDRKGAFKSVYDVMNGWGANHGFITYMDTLEQTWLPWLLCWEFLSMCVMYLRKISLGLKIGPCLEQKI